MTYPLGAGAAFLNPLADVAACPQAAEEEEGEVTTKVQLTAEEEEEERRYLVDPAQKLVCRYYENQYPELEEVRPSWALARGVGLQTSAHVLPRPQHG